MQLMQAIHWQTAHRHECLRITIRDAALHGCALAFSFSNSGRGPMSFDNHRLQAEAGENLVPCLSGESMSPDARGQTHCRHRNMTVLHGARAEAGRRSLICNVDASPSNCHSTFRTSCSRMLSCLTFRFLWSIFRRMSETPTTTTSQKSIAIHLPFVLQYASNLYRSALGAPTL